jgi:predicted ATPase
MWLYQKRLISLEEDFEKVRETIIELIAILGDCKNNGENFDKSKIKLKLDLAIGHVRLIKEQASFYLKMGRSFDLISFLDEVIGEVEKFDVDLKNRIVKTIDDRWKSLEESEKAGD